VVVGAGVDKTKTEVLKVLKDLNIQLDNLCQVNPQCKKYMGSRYQCCLKDSKTLLLHIVGFKDVKSAVQICVQSIKSHSTHLLPIWCQAHIW
jgi:hypothetical protein